MPQNRQPQSSEDGPDARRATPGEIALGMGLFIILYVIGASHLIRHEVSRNNEDTCRETVHAITGGMAETTWGRAGGDRHRGNEGRQVYGRAPHGTSQEGYQPGEQGAPPALSKPEFCSE